MRKRPRNLRKREFGIDADRIIPGVYQGSKPALESQGQLVPLPLHQAGFDSLVLAAEEFQPPARDYPGVRVLHVPFDDHENRLTEEEWAEIVGAADWAAGEVRAGRRVLITCWAGINRSGIITALTVMMLTGWSGAKAVIRVKQMRPGALRNRSFAAHVRAVG